MIQKVSDRIIIVDDLPDMGDIIAERLRLAGFENITVYSDPREALNAIRANIRPAIVITDFNMPGLTGLQLLEEIDNHHPEIDGVLVTGNMFAATEFPHRYLVLDKLTNFYPQLIAHTLDILRSHLRPLLDECPAKAEQSGCPLQVVRALALDAKIEWLNALRPADIGPLVRHHLACMGAETV